MRVKQFKINDWNSAIQVDCQHVKKQIETGKELSENIYSVGCFSLRNTCSWILHFQSGLHWVIRAWHHRLFQIVRVTSEKNSFTENKGFSLFFHSVLFSKIKQPFHQLYFLSFIRPKPCLGHCALSLTDLKRTMPLTCFLQWILASNSTFFQEICGFQRLWNSHLNRS